MVEIARERAALHPEGGRIDFREGPAEQLPVEDSIADVVFAFDSFHHWEDRAKGLSEIRRVMKPNGRFVIVKDGGIPGGDAAKGPFLLDLKSSGFEVTLEKSIEKDDVVFTMWICKLAN